ncbi:MAG: hypothetical protein NVS1B11_18820 [Terriglobales bacterium]
MPNVRRKPVLLLAFAMFLGTSADSAFAFKKHKHPAKQATQPQQFVQQAPIAPPTPSTLEHQPASAPQVTLQNGQLTIVARNSILSDILHAVQSKTGAEVEMPSNASERVVGFFGPGPSRDVLASLLNGSHFNYVLLGSQANPSVLEHVILIAKSGPDDVVPPPVAGQPQPGGVPQIQPATQPSPDAEEMPAEEVPEEAPEVEPDQQGQQNGEQQSPIQNGQPGVKTPEQLLQELQRQQQQIQQQQPQQAPGAPQGLAPQR